MATPVVADTDLLIDYLTDRGPGAPFIEDALATDALCVTAVSVAELRVGMDEASPQWERFEEVIAGEILPLETDAALNAGAAMQLLAASGQRIAMADGLIAGICRHLGLPLATRNRAHFERIEGLELVDF